MAQRCRNGICPSKYKMSDAKTPKIAVLISGRGSNMQSIVEACKSGHIKGQVCCVLSNDPLAKGLEFAKQNNIEAVSISHKNYQSREDFDTALVEKLDTFKPDVIVLAGFMRILTPVFIKHFANRILNVHPSLLPKYPGLHTHARALEAGDIHHGASVHFVTAELDAGPVIIQGVIDILSDDTPLSLAKRLLCEEHSIFPLAVAWLVNKDINSDGQQCFYKGSALVKPASWYNDSLSYPLVS
jgi:phosphoribosylglycinamide formyltransferase-1